MTDRPTDIPTDAARCRVVRPRLKKKKVGLWWIVYPLESQDPRSSRYRVCERIRLLNIEQIRTDSDELNETEKVWKKEKKSRFGY